MILIPGSTLKVFPLCLGTADMGTKIPRGTAFEILDAYAAAGGNFLDTANVYAEWLPGGRGASETLIGDWLAARRRRRAFVIGTKGAHMHLDAMDVPRMSRAEIAGDIETSLQRLRCGHIDLYWLHRDDPSRPVAEIIESLNAFIALGHIRFIGCSNWRASRIREANDYAGAHGLRGFVADQMLWNIGVPDPGAIGDKTIVIMDSELHDHHAHTGLAAIPFTSQANGFFARMAAGNAGAIKPGTRNVYHLPENIDRADRIARLSAQTGLTPTQIVLGYLLSQPFPTVPIIGPQSLDQLHDSLSAAGVRLTPGQISFIERGE